jgi:hypothetical protein
MPINGAIRPSYYVNYQSPAPNPSAVTSAKAGEMITCPHTGRIWINEATSGQPAMMVQALPYVRSGTSPSVSATKTTNDTGLIKFEQESGAIDGGVNLMDEMIVRQGGVQMPNLQWNQLLKTNGSGYIDSVGGIEDFDTVVWDAFTASWVVTQPKLTLTRVDKLSVDTTLVANTLTNIISVTVPSIGAYLVNATTNIYHNNAYHIDYSLVSQQGTTGNLAYGPSGAMDANAGYTTISLSSIINVYTIPRIIRFAVRASDAAIVKQFTNFAFPLGTIPSPQGGRSDYATTISITRVQ